MNDDPSTGAPGGTRLHPLSRPRRALAAWVGRERHRRAIASLNDRTSRGIGLLRGDVSAEAARWRRRA